MLFRSRFELNRKEVKVRTVCHPDKDMIGVSIESELLNDGNMSIYLDFPYPDAVSYTHLDVYKRQDSFRHD